jgi:hypothetical protein
MTKVPPGLRLRFLAFHGQQKDPAVVPFGPGLNVLYGASNTGKSFIVETIDFMLGGKPPLRDIPERVGYDLVLLGLETLAGQAFTLWRSIDGGGFRLYDGLHQSPPANDLPHKQLDEQHSDRNDSNLSSFLLGLCGLGGKRVRKNTRNETNSLSFRNIARLMIVNETEITQQNSPLFDGNPIANTPNLSTFKLLLTGTDDSALVASSKREPEELSREAQLQLLDQLLDDYRRRLKELTKSPKELSEQLEKIDESLRQHAVQVNTTEESFQQAAGKRRDLRMKLEEGRERRAEVGALLQRFSLLDRHYSSDIERLRAIEEGGTLFNVIGAAHCPLCGAAPTNHQADADCDGNIQAVVQAAQREIAKIEVLRTELAATVRDLEREAAKGPSAVLDDGMLILHIQPYAIVEGTTVEAFDELARHPEYFPPMKGAVQAVEIGYDGVLIGSNARGLSEPQRAYVKIDRTCTIEAVISSIATGQGTRWVELPYLQALVVRYATDYVQALSRFGIAPPFAVSLSLANVQGIRLLQDFKGTAFAEDIPYGQLNRDRLHFGQGVLESVPPGDRATARALKPILTHLANTAGLAASPYFDEEGNYTLDLRRYT